jgi:hypothetical protein
VTRNPPELDGSGAMREMDTSHLPKGLSGADRKKDCDARYTPQELASGVNSLPPIEIG